MPLLLILRLFNIGIGSTQPTNYKLEVVGGDAYIGGGVTITGNLSVGGTVTYEDVTNVDAVAIITANKGVNIVGGGLTCVGVATFFSASIFKDDVTLLLQQPMLLGIRVQMLYYLMTMLKRYLVQVQTD